MSDVLAALRRAGLDDADDSPLTRSLYASDASLYRISPQVVVRPRDADELVATLAVAPRDRHAADDARRRHLDRRQRDRRRASSSTPAGTSTGCSRSTAEARTARVQPGVVHAALQRRPLPHGLRFGPDPSTHTRCTIGGMIGNNACGSRALGYGRTVDNVESLRRAAGRRRPAGRRRSAPPARRRLP